MVERADLVAFGANFPWINSPTFDLAGWEARMR
jgi:hypothetical protein